MMPLFPEMPPIPFQVVLWPFLFGLGLYLIITAQPIGRPKPDLAERLRRLDVDERIRSQLAAAAPEPIFASPLLERMLRPVLGDAGRLLELLLSRIGLARSEDLRRTLAAARPGVSPAHFLGEKLLTGLVFLAVVPAMDALGITPFGKWPLWLPAVAFIAGFLAPDWDLDRRREQRRTEVLMELPSVLEMLTIATSAGLALEQALSVVADRSDGLVARELRQAAREMALGEGSVMVALERVAQRMAIPEVSSFTGHLRAAHEQGLPLAQALGAQAEALRERKRFRIVEEGGKAAVKMVLPVALFLLPVLFVVLLFPAAVQLIGLGR